VKLVHRIACRGPRCRLHLHARENIAEASTAGTSETSAHAAECARQPARIGHALWGRLGRPRLALVARLQSACVASSLAPNDGASHR
jgi:hypothetical protein